MSTLSPCVGGAPALGLPKATEIGSSRSYVRRGRITPAQRRALAAHWQKYGLELAPQNRDNHDVIFGRKAPCTMEVGFGNGDVLLAQARAFPERNFIGVEVHLPGVGRVLNAAHSEQLANLKIYCADVIDVLEHCIASDYLESLQLFFPDPWPKRRHRKRRLVRPDFVSLVRSKLRLGGRFLLATDWSHYALEMIDVIEASAGWRNLASSMRFMRTASVADSLGLMSPFEARARLQGRSVYNLAFEKIS